VSAAENRELVRLANRYTAWMFGEPQPDDGDLPLSAGEAAAEAERVAADHRYLRSLGGEG
jgi:hypothetical protein